ncbi:cytochrome b [Inquilinus limosus]|uniref:Cytochrome B561 n=1 Tax=Inquilinus limosus MP06 TaxID=1398085 RepID=A0A0A0D1E5_9PROT|nr:cytochrome b [Inquilinus limosus]KGM31738.1 cytochrome B561 [Inquilinus limosus MP06]
MTIHQAAASAGPIDQPAGRYDRTTILLHWLTALFVILLFALAEIWGFLPRGTPVRKGAQALHISCGLLLTVVLIARLLWRGTQGRRLPPATGGLQHLAAKAAHHALYLLLAAQVVLGFLFRWAQGEPFQFFGLFDVPAAFAPDHDLAGTIGDLHNTVAWIIIVLAGLHAAAALVHHYALRDGVLRRMLPGRG